MTNDNESKRINKLFRYDTTSEKKMALYRYYRST